MEELRMAVRQVRVPQTYEAIAWKWMRYSAILLIPLVWVHVLLQDVIVGVHSIDSSYVALRWGMLIWQVYDILLLGFAFAHGVNGLRQVLRDFIRSPQVMRVVNVLLFVFWLIITLIGAGGIVMATRSILFTQ
jgi:succinate dehydrogenase / fumarate reductase, membrane anchor subunit